MKLYTILDNEENRLFCKELIGKTLQGEIVGEYIALEEGIKILAYNAKEVNTITYEYVDVASKMQVYTIIDVNSNYSEIKIKNAICKEVLNLKGLSKEFAKNVKNSIYNCCYVKRDDYKQIQVRDDFLKAEKQLENIDIIDIVDYKPVLKTIKAEALKADLLKVHIVKNNNNRYYVYYNKICLFIAKSKKEINDKINQVGIDKINECVDNALVKYGFLAPHTLKQLEEYKNELIEEISYLNDKINRLEKRGKISLVKKSLNELNAIKVELKLVNSLLIQ